MAVLHPQECYLLEKFVSQEHYAATRDAIIAYIDAHEEALSRYLKEIPLNSRKLPLWQQADMVWGNRVMPNIRPIKDRYINAYILRSHDDIQAYSIGHAMSYIGKGITECWNGWMTDGEISKISKCESIACELDSQLTETVSGGWGEGSLTYLARDILKANPLPAKIPRYELDNSVRIEAKETPPQTGIYLPDIDFAPACFIPGNYNHPPEARHGLERNVQTDIDGKPIYDWKKSEWAKTGWTLIRRIKGEFIDVPPEGFFPEGKPEELYNWPQREKKLLQKEKQRITCWNGTPAPFDGRWASIVNGTTQYIQTRTGEVMPEFEDKDGKKHRACWSLLKRDDGGSVFVISPYEQN